MIKTLFSAEATKAWLAALAAIATALVAGVRDNVLDLRDYITAVEAGVLALTVVFGVRNVKPGKPE